MCWNAEFISKYYEKVDVCVYVCVRMFVCMLVYMSVFT